MYTPRDMKLVIIFGPPAVGKMTVGVELAKLTGLKLFHNHMLVEPVVALFGWGSPQYQRLVPEFRRRVFEEAAASDIHGLIFTFAWAFDLLSGKEQVDGISELFRKSNTDTYFIELEASLPERLKRNQSSSRLAEKPSKRDLEDSTNYLLEADRKHRHTSRGDFPYPERHFKLDTTKLPASEAAARIVAHFPSLQAPQITTTQS